MASKEVPFSPVATFTASSNRAYIENLVSQISFTQEGEGDPSPTNIRKVYGSTGVAIFRSGSDTDNPDVFFSKFPLGAENVFVANYGARTMESNGITFTQYEDDTVYARGTNTGSERSLFNYAVQTLPAGTYRLAGMPSSAFHVMVGLNSIGGTFVKYMYNGDTLEVAEDTKYGFRLCIDVDATVDDVFNPILVLVDDSTDVIENCIYGGSYDVATGALTVTWKAVDLGDFNYVKQTASPIPADAGVFRTPAISGRRFGTDATGVYGVCDSYKFYGNNTTSGLRTNLGNLEFGYQTTQAYAWFRDDAYETAEEFKAAVKGHYLIYELETPEVYQYTPKQIELLIGENNIWSNTGDVSVTYEDSDKVAIKMNSVDVTDYFTPSGMKVAYKKIMGSNGGTMLSGLRREDILAWKTVVTLICMPLNVAQQADFLSKVMVEDPTLYFYDPLTSGYKTIHYMAEISETVHRGIGGTGVEYWTGLVLTAEEK